MKLVDKKQLWIRVSNNSGRNIRKVKKLDNQLFRFIKPKLFDGGFSCTIFSISDYKYNISYSRYMQWFEQSWNSISNYIIKFSEDKNLSSDFTLQVNTEYKIDNSKVKNQKFVELHQEDFYST